MWVTDAGPIKETQLSEELKDGEQSASWIARHIRLYPEAGSTR